STDPEADTGTNGSSSLGAVIISGPHDSRGARMRLSVSVKMILTTTLLIVVTVVGFGKLIDFNLGKVFDDTARRQIETFEHGRELLGETGTLLFARTVQPLVVENKDNEIQPLMKEMVAQDTKDAGDGKKDFLLKLAFVLD